jgi:integrase/recombinase XerD
MSDWDEARREFLASRRSENTQRAYAHVLAAIEQASGKSLGEITKRDVAGWSNRMRGAGLADSTIGQRLAAVSSFFDYAADVFGLDKPNPARGRSLRGERVSAYGSAVWLDKTQVAALLGAIERETLKGKRDYALFLGYVLLGWRNSEWRAVKVSDLAGGKAHWRGKGRKEGGAALPTQLKAAVDEWLRVAGLESARRNGVMSGYVFPGQDGDGPISAEQVRNLLRKYTRLAGIECPGLHVHSLRHSAAMLRKEAGEDLISLRDFLHHNSATTTEIYVHALDRGKDTGWVKVEELLGL